MAAVYLACADRPRTAPAVAAETSLPPATVRQVFDEFAARGLMFRDEDLAVALALPARPPA